MTLMFSGNLMSDTCSDSFSPSSLAGKWSSEARSCRYSIDVTTARPVRFLQHLGVYAYRREVLLKLAATPPHPLEQSEKLEQLRALARGISIQVGVIPVAHRGVDTPADYAAFVTSVTGR